MAASNLKRSLAKQEKFNLMKADDRLRIVNAVLSWQTPSGVFPKYDLDVSAFLLGADGKLIDDTGFVYYNSPEYQIGGITVNGTPDRSVWKTPDEREGGEEVLSIDFSKLSQSITEISLVVTLHKAKIRKQTMAAVTGSKMRLVNFETGEEIAEFLLADVSGQNTAVQVGSFYREGEEFTFQAIGAGSTVGLEEFIDAYAG